MSLSGSPHPPVVRVGRGGGTRRPAPAPLPGRRPRDGLSVCAGTPRSLAPAAPHPLADGGAAACLCLHLARNAAMAVAGMGQPDPGRSPARGAEGGAACADAGRAGGAACLHVAPPTDLWAVRPGPAADLVRL